MPTAPWGLTPQGSPAPKVGNSRRGSSAMHTGPKHHAGTSGTSSTGRGGGNAESKRRENLRRGAFLPPGGSDFLVFLILLVSGVDFLYFSH